MCCTRDQHTPWHSALGHATAVDLQVLEMQSCDVDGNEWMDSFDAWRTEVVKSLLVTFFVQPPEGFSAGGACL